MKRQVFALLLAASLVGASISPVAADDFTFEMQEDSQDIAFDEPEFAEETPVVEDVAEFEEEDASNEEDSAAGFEDDNNEEDKAPSDDIVLEDSYDEDFADEDEALAETQDSFILDEESAEETVNLAEGIPIDAAHFPDPVFRDYIMGHFDDGDGYLSEDERNGVTEIIFNFYYDASSLAGIEYFENLQSLVCNDDNLTSLDLSRCTALGYLECFSNSLTSLNVSGCTALAEVDCCDNLLTSLNVSGCTALKKLACEDNQLSSLDVSMFTTLEKLDCGRNNLNSLDVSKCTALVDLDCGRNNLNSLDVSMLTTLKKLNCSSNNLSSLDVSKCTALTDLFCSSNQLKSVDISKCTKLKTLFCVETGLTSLDLSKCTDLNDLQCWDNQLVELDISNNPMLIEAYLEGGETEDNITRYYKSGESDYAALAVDNTTEIVVGNVHDHIPQVSIPGKAATCTKEGKTAEEKCSICGEILTAQETIPALGHKWGKWTTTKAATTTAEGKETRTCSRCGAKETRAIAKLPKKANPITVKSKSPSVSKTAKKAQTIKASDAFTIKNAQGTVTFKKKSGSSGKLSINSKTGLITVKKGTKAGTYKIVVAVTAAGNKQYKAGTKTVTVKIKVK